MPSQLDYDDGAFRYFSALMLLLYVFPGAYFAWGSYKSFTRKTSPEACTGRSKEETDILRARASKISLFTPCFVLNLIALAVSVVSLCIMIPALLSEDAIAQYDPFQVLGLDDSASPRDIKRAYRKLTLLYHPDKRQGHEALFIKITKAYEALTDPVAMENFKKWGNPDGKQGFSIGLGLPGFFENEELMPVIIAGYVIVLVVVVPLVFYLLYLTFKGVEVPRLKQGGDQAMYVRGQVKAFGQMYGKHRITHVVAGQADLQPEANLAAGTKRLLIPKEALEELRQTVSDAAEGKRPAGDMLAGGGLLSAGAAGTAGSVTSIPNKFGALWPTETGAEPVTVPHAIRTWAPTSQEEMRKGPPAVPSTRFIPAFRYGRPPNPAVQGDRGVPTSMFAPPMVLDRNHVMLWAHLCRIPRSTPCFKALLTEGGGAASLDKMLVLAEQSLLLSAQVTSMGMWRHKDLILGADPPTPAQAAAIMRALTKPGKKAAKKAAKKGKATKKAPPVQVGAGVGGGAAEAEAAAVAASERLGITTGFSVDSMTSDDDIADWADAVLDLMGGIDRIRVDREGSQGAADTVRMLLAAQRVGQALPPTASPLAQLPALLRSGVNLDTLEGDIRNAVNKRLDAAEAEAEAEAGAEAEASASGASPATKKPASKKPASKKPSKKPSKKGSKQPPKGGDADDATPEDDDEFAARVRSDWPQWLRLASVGWYADNGELASLVDMPATERASLLSLHAVDHSAVQEVESVIQQMPKVSLTAQCVVKRFEMLPGMAQPRIKEQVDPFAPGAVLEENEMLSVTVQLRHTNLGSVPAVATPGGQSAEEAAGAANDEDELDPDLADLMMDGEDDGDDDEDDVLAEDDGYTLRKDKRKRRRRKAADVPDMDSEPNAKVPVPEPHQPFMSRPLPKTERWAMFVCSDRGWILPAEDIWRQRRGVPQTISTVDASTARVDVELGPRFLPGPGTHKLFLVAICLDYAGMDVVKELGTVRLDISREIPRQEKRLQTLRARSSKQMEEAEHEAAQKLAEADDSASEDDEDDGGAKEETMFDEVAALMRSEKQLDAEDDDDIE